MRERKVMIRERLRVVRGGRLRERRGSMGQGQRRRERWMGQMGREAIWAREKMPEKKWRGKSFGDGTGQGKGRITGEGAGAGVPASVAGLSLPCGAPRPGVEQLE